MSNPFISVVIPSYNPGKLLSEAIKSIHIQTYRNYEIIIIDDGSTDGTREWLENNADNLKVKYVFQSNAGAAAARNKGVDLAKGDYIAFLDADDIWLPTKLELQVKSLNKGKGEYLLSFTNGVLVKGEETLQIIMDNLEDKDKPTELFDLYAKPPVKVDFNWNFKIHSIPTSSILVSKSLFQDVGGFPHLIQGEDFVLLQLILSKTNAVCLHQPLMGYRSHSNNTSSSLKKSNFRQRMSKISNKDKARIELYNLLLKSTNVPPVLKNYRYSPVIVRFLKLLFWRFSYGTNKGKIKKDFIRYVTGKGV